MNTKSTSSIRSIIILIVIVAIAAAVYFYFIGSPSNPSNTLEAQSDTGQAIGADVLSLLNQIKSLKIDTSIFKDPAYQTLRDNTIAIPPENVGRLNPFAPVPGMPGAGSTANAKR